MTSHPAPFFRQRQSNKSLDPTGHTAKFLYTILKQLDLKNVDWNEVASSLDITNGHAARMRWSRFRAQIEGLDNSYSRKGGKKKETEKKRKKKQDEEEIGDATSEIDDDEQPASRRLKLERGSDVKHELGKDATILAANTTSSLGARNEIEKKTVVDGVTIHHPKVTTIQVPPTPSMRPNNYRQPNATPYYAPTANNYPVQNMPNQGMRPAYGAQAGYPQNQWPQHPNATYGYPQRTNFGSLSSGYYPSSTFNGNQYQYPTSYASQPQPHLNYTQNPSFQQVQQPQNFQYNNNINPAVLNNRLAAANQSFYNAQMPPPTSQPQQYDSFNHTMNSFAQPQGRTPKPASSSVPDQSTIGNQAQTTRYQSASEASYPWPYSESMVSNPTQRATETRRPESGTGIQPRTDCLSSGLESSSDWNEDLATSTAESSCRPTDLLLSNNQEKNSGGFRFDGAAEGAVITTKNTTTTPTDGQETNTNPTAASVSAKAIVKIEPDLL